MVVPIQEILNIRTQKEKEEAEIKLQTQKIIEDFKPKVIEMIEERINASLIKTGNEANELFYFEDDIYPITLKCLENAPAGVDDEFYKYISTTLQKIMSTVEHNYQEAGYKVSINIDTNSGDYIVKVWINSTLLPDWFFGRKITPQKKDNEILVNC